MRWTNLECERLTEMVKSGLSDEQISRRLGRTRGAVAMQRKRLKLEPNTYKINGDRRKKRES